MFLMVAFLDTLSYWRIPPSDHDQMEIFDEHSKAFLSLYIYIYIHIHIRLHKVTADYTRLHKIYKSQDFTTP